MKEFADILDVNYNPDTDELEVVGYNGYPTYYKLSEQKLVDANERELGTELEYLIEPNLHVVLYPEYYLHDYWLD